MSFILDQHPIQYAIAETATVLRTIWNTENTPTPKGAHWERFNRCPTCEQWSPCDVRKALLATELKTIQL